ncbi:MAG: hypothetical protein AVO33_05910 [delta proteobacterium ML8_F1]|nr:MAG: hypothetical protein AVO33_05910 [delta proteobacterium ML8_F1]
MNKCSFHKSLNYKAKAEHKHNSPVKIIKLSLWFVLLFCLVFSLTACGVNNTNNEMVEAKSNGNAYQFVCMNNGLGLSVVDVLQATGEHNTFLELFSQYDPEGYAILSDVELADKTVWAPTDEAFLEVEDSLLSLSDEEIKAVLGYHISPPRRAPFTGSYPILTPQYLLDEGKMIHRTRTGVLSGSDQRTQTLVDNGMLTIEGVGIENTVWCTEAGSVFSLDAVIMNVQEPSVLVKTINRIVYILLYDDIRFVIYSTVIALLFSIIIYRIVVVTINRKKKD